MDAADTHDDPFDLFAAWFALAWSHEPDVPHAAALATAGEGGQPSCRIVLIQYAAGAGFDFYTSYESQKGRELAMHQHGALTLHWKSIGRQVRAEGPVERLAAEASDAYWESRPRASQVSASVSRQSAAIGGRAELERRHSELSEALSDEPIPRPGDWGGYRLTPLRLEFWEHRDDRLHARLDFTRASAGAPWVSRILQP